MDFSRFFVEYHNLVVQSFQSAGRLKIIYPALLAPFALHGLLHGLCSAFPAIRRLGRSRQLRLRRFGRRGYCF